MISRETIAALEQDDRGWRYILGARMRSQNEVKDEVLSRAGRYRVVHPPRIKSDDPSPLKVKEVWVGDRRYIVCLNEDEARKDAADREAIVAALREQLRSGDKSLVGNRGYSRYLSGSDSPHFRIDEAKIAEDARYDGKWVLRTNPDLDSSELALADVIGDLERLQVVEVEQDGKRFLLRSEVQGTCGKVFQTVGVALPQTVQQVPPTAPKEDAAPGATPHG